MASATRYDGDGADWRHWPFVTHAYGKTVDQCQWVQERLDEAFQGVRPQVAGRSCTRISRVGDGIAPEPDTDEIPPIILARDSWAFDSIPA